MTAQISQDLLTFTDRGIYCQRAGLFIDPRRSVPRAIITHAHADHAVAGCQHYLTTPLTARLLKHRLGGHINTQTIPYGEVIAVNGVIISLHPAGHIAGSAQVRVEYKGDVWVVTGDYKRDSDGVSEDFELIRCNTLVTESTFGLPVYRWPEPQGVYQAINRWWESNSAEGVTSILSAYSLGKAQRIVQNVNHDIGPVYCAYSVQSINNIIRESGVALKETKELGISTGSKALAGALVITPSTDMQKYEGQIGTYSHAAASGWMSLRGRKRWYNVDRGFVLSDHVDWPQLNRTVSETGCERVIVTHGYKEIFARWLNEQGYAAQAEDAIYENDNT